MTAFGFLNGLKCAHSQQATRRMLDGGHTRQGILILVVVNQQKYWRAPNVLLNTGKKAALVIRLGQFTSVVSVTILPLVLLSKVAEHDVAVPPQTPQASGVAVPPSTPLQSLGRGDFLIFGEARMGGIVSKISPGWVASAT